MNDRDKKLVWLHQEKTLIAGVDVAKHTHWTRVIDLIGFEIGKPFSFENSRDGFYRLLGKLEQTKEKSSATRVIVAMEPSGHYWKPLAHFLQDQGITVVLVNPMTVKRNKENADNTPTKNDRKDAFVIADQAKQGNFLHCMLPEQVYADLRGLSQTRQEQMRMRNAAVNRLHAVLDEYFPEFFDVFKDPLGKTAQLILAKFPFPEDLLAPPSEQEVRHQLKEVARAAGFRARLKALEPLLQAARISVGVTTGLEGARHRLHAILAEVGFWQGQLDKTEAAMARKVQETGVAQFLLSIPGVGVVTVAGFLGETGDLSKYQDWRQVRKLAGLNLSDNSSGNHNGKKRISKRGRCYLRSVLYQVTVTMVAHNPAFKALYHHFKNRPHNPLKSKQALVAVACKLLRVMFHLATEGHMYDPTKVLGPVREAQVVTAA